MRVQQQVAYVLLNRPFSETSWLSEVFTKHYGRLSLMAKGARRLKSPWRGVLLPFQPLLISWVGKGEVPTLTHAEIQPSAYRLIEHELTGDTLICGFYCNELLSRFVHRHDPHPRLFEAYHRTLKALSRLANNQTPSKHLRCFEQSLLKESGYAVDFAHEADQQTPIKESHPYQFFSGRGFLAQAFHSEKTVSGRVVLALSETPPSNLSLHELNQARDLMRLILQQNSNHRSIISRRLFYSKAVSAGR